MRSTYVEISPSSQKFRLQPALNAPFTKHFSSLPVSEREVVVAKVFPCVVCIVHAHILGWIPSQTCTDAFVRLTF